MLSHLKQLQSQIKYMTHGFQIQDIRQYETKIPEERETNKVSHVTPPPPVYFQEMVSRIQHREEESSSFSE